MRTPAQLAGHPIHPMLVTLPIGMWVFSLVADLIARFVNLDPDLIESAIVDAQRRLVLALDVDRSALFEVSGDDLRLTHYWSRPEFAPDDELYRSSPARFPTLPARVIGGETLTGAGATPQGVYDRVDIHNPVANTWRLGTSTMPTFGSMVPKG